MNEVKFIGSPECSVGNGVLATLCGKTFFFTSAHVVRKLSSISVDSFDIPIEEKNIYYTESIWTKILCVLFGWSKLGWLFHDFAVFECSTSKSELELASTLPVIGEVLTSHSIKLTSESVDSGLSIFSRQEKYVPYTTSAQVVAIRGNFIFCKMDNMLEKGRSGSPLVKNGKVYGILRGGDDKSICWYESSVSIMKQLNLQ